MRVIRKKTVPLTANNLTLGVKNYIKMHGGWAVRVNTMGIYDADKGVYRTIAEEDRGVSDVIGVYKGFALFIEIKVGKDTKKRDQKKFQFNVEGAGAWYYIARNMNDFITNFNIKKNEIDNIRGVL